MPRARKLVDQELPGLDEFDKDPEPVAARPRRGRPPAKTSGSQKARIPARTPAGRIMSKAQMITKVQAEVSMYLMLAQGAWDLRDPTCAAVATQDRLDIMAESMTNMIARNETMLKYAASSGIIGDIVKILHAVLPIAREVWRNHGPGGLGHQSIEEVTDAYAQRFPPYAPAVAG